MITVDTLAAAAPRHPGWAQPWLVADIGGTHARFGWVAPGEDRVGQLSTLKTADHADPAAAARCYLDELARRLGTAYSPPQAAAFAVATAVSESRITLTNAGWSFTRRDTERALGLTRLQLLNDFEALALSLPQLGPDQLRPIGDLAAPADPRAVRAVIGPGTGLGVAGLVGDDAGGWIALPGEGGHATLAPTDAFESELLAAARRDFPHVSAERLLSGIGLPVLYRAVASATGGAIDAAAAPTARDIVDRGLAGTDAVADRTLDAFCALLGSFAGNVALVLGARGGVYIGGGIVPRLGERFFRSRFRERFEAKGRFDGYLRAIPTLLITDTLAALAGAASALRQGR